MVELQEQCCACAVNAHRNAAAAAAADAAAAAAAADADAAAIAAAQWTLEVLGHMRLQVKRKRSSSADGGECVVLQA